MSRKRISMRKIKEVLRLKYEAGLTYEQIGKSISQVGWFKNPTSFLIDG